MDAMKQILFKREKNRMVYFSVVVRLINDDCSDLINLLHNIKEQHIEKLDIILVCKNGEKSNLKKLDIHRHLSVNIVECDTNNYIEFNRIGIEKAKYNWITFLNHYNFIPHDYFNRVDEFLKRHSDDSIALILPANHLKENMDLITVDELTDIPEDISCCFFKKEILCKPGIMISHDVRPGFEDTAIIARYLLACSKMKIGYAQAGRTIQKNINIIPENSTKFLWSEKYIYNEVIKYGYVSLLAQASQAMGFVPDWLQKAVLQDLHWYFKVEMGERAPTSWISERMAADFHSLVTQVMSNIDIHSLESFDLLGVEAEVLHALFSYMDEEYHPKVYLDAYDHDQDMVRISYYVHGKTPVENILLDGKKAEPAHSKYRSCNFFRRSLYFERIAWVSVSGADSMKILLDDQIAPLCLGRKIFSPVHDSEKKISLSSVREALPPGRPGRKPIPSGLRGFKARLLRWLARNILVRRYFKDSWVFADRENEADDNAEHLYRWIKEHHPKIKAWFLLSRSSSDWNRLSKEGFRLVPRTLFRKLLLLNCKHIISSQPEFVNAGFSSIIYGDLMTWRFTYLKHGVVVSDLSHWYNGLGFDRIITATPDEHNAIAGDKTPYCFTSKEATRAGLCRHDMLRKLSLQIQEGDVDTILVMPTWRGKLGERVSSESSEKEKISRFANSQYAQRWGSLLRNVIFQKLAKMHNKKIVFMPHPNSVPYLVAFDIPNHVEVKTKLTGRIQKVFCQTAVMITDYSSVVFEMAYLQRPVIYYQFDIDQFFGNDHNWRQGFFDYSRDGFGPVAVKEEDVFSNLNLILNNSAQPESKYLQRMKCSFPERDGKSCERVYESILKLERR